MKILYLTYDGLSDPLGQSQILPYLTGLADKGFDITIVSFEKSRKLKIHYDSLRKELDQHNIKWKILSYTKHPPVLSTLYDIFKLKTVCRQLQKNNKFQLVHCRSYITSLVGLQLKRQYGMKFLFDMRGFYADERIESGLWNQSNVLYRRVYQYFKKKEKEFITSADKIVVLTNAAKNYILKSFQLDASKLEVIPCCVDTQLFDPDKIDLQIKSEWKTKLAISDTDFVVSYLGAIGTWYLLDEMLDFFRELIQTYPTAKFLFITHHSPSEIFRSAAKKHISKENIIVTKAERIQVPVFLSLSRLNVFFIKPSFSKTASSPTKQAEVLSMGIPVVCNAGIGDALDIFRHSKAGFAIQSFSNDEFKLAIAKIPELIKTNKVDIRELAIGRFSLADGISKYNFIYKELNPI